MGSWVVLFGKQELLAETVSYSLTEATTKHLLLNLKPSTNYTLLAKSEGGATVRSTTVASSSSGSLRFDCASTNERQFILSPGGQVLDTTAPAAPHGLRTE